MKKIQKNSVLSTSAGIKDSKFILHSLVTSFQMEGIFIPEKRVQAIYARVNEKLKK